MSIILPFFPDKWIVRRTAGVFVNCRTRFRMSGNLSKIIGELSVTLSAAQGTQVPQNSELPDDAFRLPAGSKRACVGARVLNTAGYLAEVIDPNCMALISVGRTQWENLAVRSPDHGIVQRRSRRVRSGAGSGRPSPLVDPVNARGCALQIGQLREGLEVGLLAIVPGIGVVARRAGVPSHANGAKLVHRRIKEISSEEARIFSFPPVRRAAGLGTTSRKALTRNAKSKKAGGEQEKRGWLRRCRR
jgi:hypothetical protein